LDHDLPLARVELTRNLLPSSVQMWINGCLIPPDDYQQDSQSGSITVLWVLLKGDTIRVSGSLTKSS
jgi:hypothetical protein